MMYVGIDPGVRGAVVILQRDGSIMWRAPWNDAQELVWTVAQIADHYRGMKRIAVEHVQAQPKFGAKASFRFGYHAGMVEALLTYKKLVYEFVRPSEWQRMLRKEDGRNPKQRARNCAARLWPGQGAHQWTEHAVDAALIAEWLRRREK